MTAAVAPSTTPVDAVALANRLLASQSSTSADPFELLSFAPGLPPVSVNTPVAEARRNYMRLAGLLHPDKLKGFERATEAFQILVRVFEQVADPRFRKSAAAAAARKAVADVKKTTPKKESITSIKERRSKAKEVKSKKRERPAKDAKRGKSKRRRVGSDDDEDDGSESDSSSGSSSEDEVSEDNSSEDEEGASDSEVVTVSTSRALIGTKRLDAVHRETNIGCPNCRTVWIPDSKPQYSLFMGPVGKKVHCQLCLLRFGCATAIHGCPNCDQPFEYDQSMYDSTITCGKCKKPFGFAYFPVNQMIIDQVRAEEAEERASAKKAAERQERAARRGPRDGGSGSASNGHGKDDATLMLVGKCIVDEMCPLCGTKVTSKHRAHVEACASRKPAPPAALSSTSPKSSQGTSAPQSQRAATKNQTEPKRSSSETAPRDVQKQRSGATLSSADDLPLISLAGTPPARPSAGAKKAPAKRAAKQVPAKRAAAAPSRKRRSSDSDDDDDDDDNDDDDDDESSASDDSDDENSEFSESSDDSDDDE